MWKLWIRMLGNLALIRKREEKRILIFQRIKGESLWTSQLRTKSNSSTDLYPHKRNQMKGSYLSRQVTCWTSVKSYSRPLLRVRYNQDSAGLTLYNAYLSSAGITLRQLHIQIIRKKGIWPEGHLNRNMALICCPNIFRASQMAPEINVWPTDSNPKSFQSGEPKDLSVKPMPADKSAPLVASVHGRNVWFGCLRTGIWCHRDMPPGLQLFWRIQLFLKFAGRAASPLRHWQICVSRVLYDLATVRDEWV